MDNKFKTKIALLMIIMIMVFFPAGCEKMKPAGKSPQKEEAAVIPVKVHRVVLKDLAKTLEYVGNIKAQDEALVYPKVSGKIIQKVKQEGSFVTKGDILAYIDRDEVGLKFEKAPVESSLSGVVGQVYVDIGSSVNSQTPVALVVDMGKVKIDLGIPEQYVSKVYLEQKASVKVDAYPDRTFVGSVTKVSPIVDIQSRTASIEITIDNTEYLLRSGMFARVSLIIEERKNAVAILREAVMGKEPDCYVYTVEGDKAVIKKVALGIRQAGYYEVAQGLKEGDLVVIMGQQRLYENAKVVVEE